MTPGPRVLAGRIRRFAGVIVAGAALAWAGGATADEEDSAGTAASLARIQAALTEARSGRDTVAADLRALEADLVDLQADLAAATRSALAVREELAATEATLVRLEEQATVLEQDLRSRRRALAGVMRGLHQAARVPHGVLWGGGSAIDRLRAEHLLRRAVATVRDEAAALSADTDRLADLRDELHRDRARLADLLSQRNARLLALETEIDRRRWLIERTRRALDATLEPLDELDAATATLASAVDTLTAETLRDTRRDTGRLQRDRLSEALSALAQAAREPASLGIEIDVIAAPVDREREPFDPTSTVVDLPPRSGIGSMVAVEPAVPAAEALALARLVDDSGLAGAPQVVSVSRGRTTRLTVPLPTIDGVLVPSGGHVEIRFGDPDVLGEASDGVRIRGEAEAPVVAPLSGTVRFAAALGSYGRTLILEHSGGYHSVIAGIGRVDVAVGQDVLMGETLGSMPVPQNGHTDTVSLYYELRQFGRPIDPFQGLMTAQR